MINRIIKKLLINKGYEIRHQSVLPTFERLSCLRFASGLGDLPWSLHGLVRSMRPEVCVEIGSAQGKSTCYIASALAELGKGDLYAIDPHQATDWNDSESVDSLPILKQNLASLGPGVEKRVQIIRKTSQEAAVDWNKPIDFLFIDGDHSYEGVKQDWELFSPFVKQSGIIAFHDTAWHLEQGEAMAPEMGVPRFVEELRKEGYPVVTLLQNHGLSLVQPEKGGMPLYKGHSGAW